MKTRKMPRLARHLVKYFCWALILCGVIRSVRAQTYTISTFAGGGACVKNSAGVCAPGDGGPATSAYLTGPTELGLDPSGNLYMLDAKAIRKVTPGGTISSVDLSFLPQDCSYILFCLSASVSGMAFDNAGDLYMTTSGGSTCLPRTARPLRLLVR